MKCAVLAVTMVSAAAQRPGKSGLALPCPKLPCLCDLKAVFADMHDGDQKEVTISGKSMTIKPYGSDAEWVVNTEFDCSTLQAAVDFNVPGKADHPPIPITATLYTCISATGYKSTFIYTDPSKTLVDDHTFPLNEWVAEVLDGGVGQYNFICPLDWHAIYADMHDGDMKEVTIDGESMTIKPSGNDQEWTVKATFDRKTCSASVDFHVPGKPGYPPVPLLATFWYESAVQTPPNAFKAEEHSVFEFTDPSGTLAAAGFPLNRWIGIRAAEQHV